MLISTTLNSKNLALKNLTHESNLDSYFSWLNDNEITEYLEVRFNIPKNVSEIKNFIRTINDSKDSILFGIFHKDSNIHIGNIKLDLNKNHRRGEIGLLIGNKSFWGKGYATEAIEIVTKFAFEDYDIDKVSAGCYEDNIGSAKAFLKVGFIEEARLKEHWLHSNKRQDGIILSKLKS